MTADFYGILGVASDASTAEIKRAYFRSVKEHSPEKDPEQFKLIRAAYETLSDDAARRDYDALQAYGGEIETLNEEAEDYIELEEWAEAIRCYKRILVLHPESNAARNSLGLCYMQSEDYGAAAKTFAQLVKQSPDSTAYWLNLGWAQMHVAEEHEEQSTAWTRWLTSAQESFHKAVLLDSLNSDAHQAIALVRRQFADWDGSVTWLESAVSADGVTDLHDVDALIQLCFVYVITDDHEKLTRTLERLVDVAPEDGEAREYMAGRLAVLGAQMVRAKRFSEAAIAFEHAMKLDPEDDDLAKARDYSVHVERGHDEWLRLEPDSRVVPPLKFFAAAALSSAFDSRPSDTQRESAVEALATYPVRSLSSSLDRMESLYPSLYWLNREWFDYLSEQLHRTKRAPATASSAPMSGWPPARRTTSAPIQKRGKGRKIFAIVAVIFVGLIAIGVVTSNDEPTVSTADTTSELESGGDSYESGDSGELPYDEAESVVDEQLDVLQRLNDADEWTSSRSASAQRARSKLEDAASVLFAEPALRQVALKAAAFAHALDRYRTDPTDANYEEYDSTRKDLNSALSEM